MSEHEDPATPEPDPTVVVSRRPAGDPASDPDLTVATPRRPAEEPSGEGGGTEGRGGGLRRTGARRDPAPPIAEETLIPGPEFAALMFKKPLDPRRMARESPFPATPDALPRLGVRPGLPVRYPARPGEAAAADAENVTESGRRIGDPPPARTPPGAASRDGLASTERANRRFRVATLAGLAAALSVSVGGLWLLARLVLG